MRALTIATDIAIATTVILCPLIMGGRHPVGRLAFTTVVAAAALCWITRQWLARGKWSLSGAELLLAAGGLLVCMQFTPLPTSLLQTLSPQVGQLLPLWSDGSGAGLSGWTTISLAPRETTSSLLIYLSYGLLFLVVCNRVQSLADVESVLKLAAVAAGVMATVGIAQYLAGDEKFLWFYQHPFRTALGPAKGPFINPNHFAHFLALGVGPLLWWIYQLVKGDETAPSHRLRKRQGFDSAVSSMNHGGYTPVVLSGVLIAVIAASVLSGSVGGACASILGLAVVFGVFLMKSMIGRRELVFAITAATLLSSILLLHGYDSIVHQAQPVTNAEDVQQAFGGRWKIWTSLLAAAPDFAATGTGAGTHEFVYPIYYEYYNPLTLTHAESGYLQILLEMGAPGITLLVLGVGLIGYWTVTTLRRSDSARTTACAAAALAGVVVSLAHSTIDFVWYLPATMALAILLLSCLAKLASLDAPHGGDSQNSRQWWARPFSVPQPAWLAAGAAVLLFGGFALAEQLPQAMASPRWDHYLQASIESRGLNSQSDEAEPAVDEMIARIEAVLQADEADPTANVRLAGLCLRKFDLAQQQSANAMPLAQIRDAALGSAWRSPEDKDRWVNLVVGENRVWLDKALTHARRGLHGCPLVGEGYLYLSELDFLRHDTTATPADFLAQAQQVRPGSGDVLLAMGKEAALQGDLPKAIEAWKRAFHHSPPVRARLMDSLCQSLPPQAFVQIFEPGLSTIRQLHKRYAKGAYPPWQAASRAILLEAVVARANDSQGRAAAELWLEAERITRSSGDQRTAIEYVRKAADALPDEYDVRHHLAKLLFDSGEYEEAITHLQWCLKRDPGNHQLRQSIIQAQSKSAGFRLSSQPDNDTDPTR